MKRAISLIVMLFVLQNCWSLTSLPKETDLGILSSKRGNLRINGKPLRAPLDSSGAEVQLYFEDLDATQHIGILKTGIFLFRYVTSKFSKDDDGIVVLDMLAGTPRFSNLVPLKAQYSWDDNNYALINGDAIYFGMFEVDQYKINRIGTPSPIQFVYKDGKLIEDKGPWMGPAKPEKYIEPDKSLPCANVANVPECLAEVERSAAAKRKRKSSSMSKPPAPSGAASSAGR